VIPLVLVPAPFRDLDDAAEGVGRHICRQPNR
jgi:hypothetical protein